jgi:hypothetical protein
MTGLARYELHRPNRIFLPSNFYDEQLCEPSPIGGHPDKAANSDIIVLRVKSKRSHA